MVAVRRQVGDPVPPVPVLPAKCMCVMPVISMLSSSCHPLLLPSSHHTNMFTITNNQSTPPLSMPLHKHHVQRPCLHHPPPIRGQQGKGKGVQAGKVGRQGGRGKGGVGWGGVRSQGGWKNTFTTFLLPLFSQQVAGRRKKNLVRSTHHK